MHPTIEAAARGIGLLPNQPGFEIVAGPREIFPNDDPGTAMMKLMSNFYAYGRGPGNFTWQSALGEVNGPNAYTDSTKRGLNLLTGNCRETNCDGFRNAFINLATNVLRIGGVGYRSIGPIVNGGYLTHPGTLVIDAAWSGNVRTEQKDFATVKSFKFSEHHFVAFQGRLYDPTTNMTFVSEDEMKWCSYTIETDPKVNSAFSGLRVFRINQVHHANLVCNAPRYLVEIGSSGGWPTNLLTTETQLKYAAVANMTVGTSRVS